MRVPQALTARFRVGFQALAKNNPVMEHTNPERVRADYAVLAEHSKGLSGRDILYIFLNAIYAGSTDLNP